MRSRSVVAGCLSAYFSVTNFPVPELRCEICVGVLLLAIVLSLLW